MQEQIQAPRENPYDMRNYDQAFYRRQREDFERVPSILSLRYSNVESHRKAFLAFQITLSETSSFLLSKNVTTSLLRAKSLEKHVEVVDYEQHLKIDSICPCQNRNFWLITKNVFYRMFRTVSNTDDSFLMTMAGSFASQQQTLTACKGSKSKVVLQYQSRLKFPQKLAY